MARCVSIVLTYTYATRKKHHKQRITSRDKDWRLMLCFFS